MVSRVYATRRMGIVDALVEKLKEIDGTGDFHSDVYYNVSSRLLFWDEVKNFPSIHVSASTETRTYQGGGFKDRTLNLIIRCYVNKQDVAVYELDKLLEDIETVVEDNGRLPYLDKNDRTQYTRQMSIISIDTDEGVLDPLGIGEIQVEVEY